MFWGDEIMGDAVLRAGSFKRFLELWRGGVDSSGIWFYVFAKPWEWIFGASEGSLRMYSAAGVAIAAALIWLAARRYYALPVVAAATSLIFLDMGVLRWQLANGRCYGVLMCSAALVVLVILAGEQPGRAVTSRPFLLCTFASYCLLTGSHILGVLYAAAFLALQIYLDLRARRSRLLMYAAALIGIVFMVAFSLANIRSTAAAGKPAFWTETPSFRQVFLLTPFSRSPVRTLLLGLLVISLFSLRWRPARRPVYDLLAGFLFLDFCFFGFSRVTTSIYVDRYLLPLGLGLALLGAELLTQITEARFPSFRIRALAPAAFLLLVLWNMPLPRDFGFPQRDYTSPLLARLPPGIPVVDTDAASFVEVEYYHHGKLNRPFLYPQDPEITADPTNPGGASGFHEIDNFRRFGLDAPDIQSTTAILADSPELLILTGPHPTSWFRRRIEEGGRYIVTDLGPMPGVEPTRLWEAHKR